MHKITYKDLRPDSIRLEMTNFVRRFTPRSWWPHLMPSMVQLWAVILQRSAFAGVGQDLFKALGIFGEPFGGAGTWFRDAEGVNYAWSGAGRRMVWKVPEWGLGVWREVTNAFLHNTTPFADWSDEFEREDMEDLGEALALYSRGHRVFEALGILGGTWSPAEGVAPSEKALDNLN